MRFHDLTKAATLLAAAVLAGCAGAPPRELPPSHRHAAPNGRRRCRTTATAAS
jgi:predicted small lipoprotein YifL